MTDNPSLGGDSPAGRDEFLAKNQIIDKLWEQAIMDNDEINKKPEVPERIRIDKKRVMSVYYKEAEYIECSDYIEYILKDIHNKKVEELEKKIIDLENDRMWLK